jgi:hypothetical protein
MSNKYVHFVGKTIQWEVHYRLLYKIVTAKVIEVKGRNALIDQSGSTDWVWPPDLTNVRIKP